MAFPKSLPLWIGAIALTILFAAAAFLRDKPLPARQTDGTAPPGLPTPPVPAESPTDETPRSDARLKKMRATLDMEFGEARVASLVTQLKAARTPVEWAAGLQLLPAAGPPAAVWEGLRTLLREGSVEMAPTVAEKMIAVNPPQAMTALAGIMSSPAEPTRLVAAVHALHQLAKSSPSLAGPAAAALTHAGLKSPDRAVRKAVLDALVEVATSAEAPRLKEYAAGETDRELRELAERAAER